MGYRLVPKSVTLNDLERRYSPSLCVYLRNSVAFGTDYSVTCAIVDLAVFFTLVTINSF